MIAKITKNELDLSLYSLSLKTRRYGFSNDNRLAVFGIRLAVFMLPLQQIFEFYNIRHSVSKSGQPLATVTATVNYYLKL